MADDEDADRIREAFGFRPAGRIGFAAMCNDPEDHRILAHLCEKTALRAESRRERGEPPVQAPCAHIGERVMDAVTALFERERALLTGCV